MSRLPRKDVAAEPTPVERGDAAAVDSAAPVAGTATDCAVITGLALVVWIALVATARWWGLALMAEGRKIVLFTPPVLGGGRVAVPTGLWVPIVVAAAAIGFLPWATRRLRWRALVPTAGVTALGWWIALASVDGSSGLTAGLDWETDYAPVVGRAGQDPVGFLRGYVDQLPTYGIQLRGHPPGFALLLGLLDRVGLRGVGWATVVVLIGAVSMVPAVLLTVREVAGETTARRALPFVALAPAALWIATSVDAFYLGVTAWAVAAMVFAVRRTGRTSDRWAVLAGVLAVTSLLLSYGLVLLACIPLAVVVGARRLRPVLVAAGVGAVLLAALAALGFWWGAGLQATRFEYDTLDLDRPYTYFLVNNLAAWALALGPAVFVALARLRDRRLWMLVGGGVAAALLADLSGLSEGEVERIWLPFTIWVLPATAVLGARLAASRAWLTLQVATAVVITAVIGTRW